MSEKSKSVAFAFSPRQLQISQELIREVVAEMAEKRTVTSVDAEREFYGEQTKRYFALAELLQPDPNLKKNSTRKIRLSEEQFHMLSGSLAHRNRLTLIALHNLPDGDEKSAGLDAYTDWETFSRQLERKDPRQYDRSQDAEPEDDEDEDEDEESDDDGEIESSN